MKLVDLVKVSNPVEVKRRFEKYRGSVKATIEPSPREDKKYMIRVATTPATRGRTILIGSTLEDYTKHGDQARRKSYLARSAGIKGDWKSDKWSANLLSRELLW